MRAGIKIRKGFFYRFRYLPSNGIIASVILHDLEISFEGPTL